MDNNPTQPTAPTTPVIPPMPTNATTPAAPPASPAPSAPPNMTVTPAKSTPKWLFIIIGLVLLALIGAGGYWFYTQRSTPEAPQITTPTVTEQTTAPKTEDSSLAELKAELDSLVATEVSADFTAIDQDLKDL